MKNLFKQRRLKHVSHTFDLHDVNYFLLGYVGENSNSKSLLYADYPPITVHDVISITDKEFKRVKPTKKELVLWRGIEGYDLFKERFERSYNVKKGDIVYMPEYAFASGEKIFAEGYTGIKKGILYEIDVPKGAKLSLKGHYIFPRYSKFECIGSEEQEKYKLIKLKYLPKEDSLSNFLAKKLFSYFNKNTEVINANK